MLRPFTTGRLFALLLAPLLLSACDDRDDVGLDLIGGQGGEPVGIPVFATTAAKTEKDFTGGQLTSVSGQTGVAGAAQVLAGRVVDPLLGTFEATGYLDTGAPSALSAASSVDSFRLAPLTSARLELRRISTYGDTTGAVQLELRPITAEIANPANANSDTTYATGAPIMTFTVGAGRAAERVRLTLPASFLATADTALRSRNVATSFHGFALTPVSGGAVVGFAVDSTRLVVATAKDTVRFSPALGASTVRRTGTVSVPPGRAVLQDGVPSAFDLTLRLDTSRARGRGLARGAVVLSLDTLALSAGTPPGFYRTRLPSVELVGVDSTGQEVASGLTFLVSAEAAPRGDRLVLTSSTLSTRFRDALLGRSSRITALRLRTPARYGGLGVLVFHTAGADAPRAILTTVEN